MTDEKTDSTRRDARTGDTAEYSGSKAPETRGEAEETVGPSDARLRPGGALGSRADVGMSNLDRGTSHSGGESTDQERFGEMRKKE